MLLSDRMQSVCFFMSLQSGSYYRNHDVMFCLLSQTACSTYQLLTNFLYHHTLLRAIEFLRGCLKRLRSISLPMTGAGDQGIPGAQIAVVVVSLGKILNPYYYYFLVLFPAFSFPVTHSMLQGIVLDS